MNRLVNALMAHPQVIEEEASRVIEEATATKGAAAGDENKDLAFERILDTLGGAIFSESELQLIQNDDGIRRRLEKSYLPTINAKEWTRALSLTENRTATRTGWWTVMMAGISGQIGLTAPQDDSRTELVALFTGPADDVKVLVYEPAVGTITEIGGGRHCAPPSRGICHEGTCHGCKSRTVNDKATGGGIKCGCSHQGW